MIERIELPEKHCPNCGRPLELVVCEDISWIKCPVCNLIEDNIREE